MGCQFAAFGVADEQAPVRRDQLPLRIDDRQNAAHEGQDVQGLAAGFQMQFMQFAALDVEPPSGAGGRIEGRSFAEFECQLAENPAGKGNCLAHAHAPYTAS